VGGTSKRLTVICRWMGSHFLSRIDLNRVTFSVESVEWACTFFGLLGLENSGVKIRFEVKKLFVFLIA